MVEIKLGIVMEGPPHIWVAFLNWFTCNVIFVLLNVVTRTIIVTSGQ
jgi:hypothetical protein